MTDKELMEDALEWQEHIRKLVTATDDELYHKRSKVFDWLIKQAERVQELEKFKQEMEDRYKIWHIGAKKSLAEKEQLLEQNQRYRKALEFYADQTIYKEELINEASYDADGVCISNDEYAPPAVYLDGGEKARKALEGKE